MSARGIRNRNPGNIEAGSFTQSCAGYAGPEPEGRFATFISMALGLLALMRLLKAYRTAHGLATVRGIINRWAPPKENVTSAYVDAVSRELGAEPDEHLPDTPDVYRDLARAIAHHENGADAAQIAGADYEDAVSLFTGATSVPRAAPAPTPPKEEKPMLPVIAAAIPALMEMAPALIRVFGSGGQVSERNAQAAEIVANVAKNVAGTDTVEGAINALRSSPELLQAFQKGVQDRWFELTEIGGGIEKAREAAVKAQADKPPYMNPALWVSGALLPLVYLVVARVLFSTPETFNNEIKVLVITAVITGVLGAITGFWLGSSMSSRSKDDILARR
jgi:hypothetical protein